MNKTNSIATHSFERPNDKIEAQEYFKRLYPSIEYDHVNDEYHYRGRKFDYFKSGISINGGPNSYLLIDQETRVWLFTYGEEEKMWLDFLKEVNNYIYLNEEMNKINK